MSGSAVIIWSYGLIVPFLYYRSPIALERLSPPFTRPKDTVPPALVILVSSLESYGLWSKLSGSVFVATDATALESPEFAQYIF